MNIKKNTIKIHNVNAIYSSNQIIYDKNVVNNSFATVVDNAVKNLKKKYMTNESLSIKFNTNVYDLILEKKIATHTFLYYIGNTAKLPYKTKK